MKIGKLIFLLTFYVGVLETHGKRRSKRYLMFPRGGSSKIVLGIGIPLKLGTKQSMGIGWNFQAQYTLPQNVTQLKNYPPTYGRVMDKREVNYSDRSLVYATLESILDGEGYKGRECMLRSICESAVDRFNLKENGLYGQILHILFTPTYGDGEVDPELDPAYLEAQRAGEFGVECDTLYPNCGINSGFLSLFSVVENQLSYVY